MAYYFKGAEGKVANTTRLAKVEYSSFTFFSIIEAYATIRIGDLYDQFYRFMTIWRIKRYSLGRRRVLTVVELGSILMP